jgi:hypothetical protein
MRVEVKMACGGAPKSLQRDVVFLFLSSTNRWVGNSFLPDSDEIFFRSQAYAD